MSTLGVGVAGFDHWYAALAACEDAARDERCRLVAVAGEPAQLPEFARQRGAAFLGPDPLDVVAHPGVDVVVCAASSDRNPALVAAAAERGKPVLSVKPMAHTEAAALAVRAAVQRTGIPFFPLECQGRLRAADQRLRAWWGRGERLGPPLSALVVMRGSVPREDWPGHPVGQTWWTDPARVPGGGWIDHAIYEVDFLRWALGAEVDRVCGAVATRKHPELAVEDFGLATLTFAGGVVAAVEVTWHGTRGVGAGTRQFVGTRGQLLASLPGTKGWLLAEEGGQTPGWRSEAPPTGGCSPLAHMVDHLSGGVPLAAGVEDGLANLRACLAFYRAAAEGGATGAASTARGASGADPAAVPGDG